MTQMEKKRGSLKQNLSSRSGTELAPLQCNKQASEVYASQPMKRQATVKQEEVSDYDSEPDA